MAQLGDEVRNDTVGLEFKNCPRIAFDITAVDTYRLLE